MKNRLFLLTSFSFLSSFFYAQDTLALKSGDTLVCKIDKVEGKKIFFRAPSDTLSSGYRVSSRKVLNFKGVEKPTISPFDSIKYVRSNENIYKNGNFGFRLGANTAIGFTLEKYYHSHQRGIQLSAFLWKQEEFYWTEQYAINDVTFYIPTGTSSRKFDDNDLRSYGYQYYKPRDPSAYEANRNFNYDKFHALTGSFLLENNFYIGKPYRKLRGVISGKLGLGNYTYHRVKATSNYFTTEFHQTDQGGFGSGMVEFDEYLVDVQVRKESRLGFMGGLGTGGSWKFLKFASLKFGIDFYVFQQTQIYSSLQVTNKDNSVNQYGGEVVRKFDWTGDAYCCLIFNF